MTEAAAANESQKKRNECACIVNLKTLPSHAVGRDG